MKRVSGSSIWFCFQTWKYLLKSYKALNFLPIIEVWLLWNAHIPNHSSHSQLMEIQSTHWKFGRGSELHHSSRQTACCTGQTSAVPALCFTSETVNRSQGGELEVDWWLASLDSVSFTRSLSIALTSYKRHFCTLGCTGEHVGLYTETHWVETNTNNSQWACTVVYSIHLHSDKMQE